MYSLFDPIHKCLSSWRVIQMHDNQKEQVQDFICVYVCMCVCVHECLHACICVGVGCYVGCHNVWNLNLWVVSRLTCIRVCINMIDKSVLKEVLCGVMLIMERRFKIYLPINTLFSHHCRHHHTVAILFYDFHKASQPRNTKRQGPNHFVFASLLIGYVTPSIGQCQNFN